MIKKGKNLKFLSQSVLLEESGLPGINTLIILVVFTMVVSFIVWSNLIKIDEVTTVKGEIVQAVNEEQSYSFTAKIPSEDIGKMRAGLTVSIKISGRTDKSSIDGRIESIGKKAITDQSGNKYYSAVIKINDLNEVTADSDVIILSGMQTDVNIIVGSNTLLHNLLGPVFKSIDKTF